MDIWEILMVLISGILLGASWGYYLGRKRR